MKQHVRDAIRSPACRCGAGRTGRRRRGAIFVTALGIIVILSALLLVFTQEMSTQAVASANRLAYIQADAVEQAAEQWVLAQIEANRPDSMTITQIPAQAVPLYLMQNISTKPAGTPTGYFWLLNPDPTQTQFPAFGIADESAKLNLNTVSRTLLANLPTMDQQTADAIVDWRNPSSSATVDGAESSYYESLQPDPYICKNAPYDSVEELLLVKSSMPMPQLLWEMDANRNGILDASEQAAGQGLTELASDLSGGVVGQRGIGLDLTCYSVDLNVTRSGKSRVYINAADTTRLRNVLSGALGATRAAQIVSLTHPVGRRRRGGASAGATRFSLGGFFRTGEFQVADIKKTIDLLTDSRGTTLAGRINVNTAPQEVLMCLPGLEQSDADELISQRNNESDLSTIGWVYDALSTTKANAILDSISARSFQYSADIVAVSPDGRAFKRVRIVVDAQALPAKVVYRRELTSLGWPLPVSSTANDPQDIRNMLRAGKVLPYPGTNVYTAQP